MFKIVNFEMRMATEADQHLPTYDNTKLSNINTCPTWGILRYSMHKKMPGSSRSMALEAGAAAHDSFAALRLYQLIYNQDQHDLGMYHGHKQFGEDRFSQMINTLTPSATHQTNMINFATEALYTSGFYDDPTDRNRTVSNISESLVAYIRAWDAERYPLWIRDTNDPTSDIGVEIAFDIVVSLEYTFDNDPTTVHTIEVRFTGKLDGLHWNKLKLMVIENKTGARLDNSWLAQWMLSHQVTGYCLASTMFTQQQCDKAMVLGMKIPVGRNILEATRYEIVNRNQFMYQKWAEWFLHSILLERDFVSDIKRAPMYTHSCNRYFNSCSFVPFCMADPEEKDRILEDMEDDEWSPLHE